MDVHNRKGARQNGARLSKALSQIRPISTSQNLCAEVLVGCRIGDTFENFRFAVALHVGKLLYGNIGGGNRLDFTCIGPAVNLAARLEKIAARLNREVVSSSAFARLCEDNWADLGEFPIAGFSKAERIYGLAEETPPSTAS